MKTLLVMDAKNYDPGLGEIRRTAVRGIIFVDGRLLMIQSGFGEVMLPGGGQEAGESDEDTLIRETLEETGFHVIPDSIRPFGQVEEKRLSTHEPMIWHMTNRYYFCEVDGSQEACQYTENEKSTASVRYGTHWMMLSASTKRCSKERASTPGISGNTTF